ncbi:hypothetical protein AtNW77_Chr5g0112211 [Arabidopsis thaliana]|jgi:hypothetical protein|nr:tagatose-6-phosphate ketose/aldose isomerase, putative (Mog1/PsbP/DUF1795-like photosystem II reaction center PsbP family protein) [Arabidopsis thaliana]KAG7603641.1 Mog1/PsbP alpha/beta/alpha sandwich [Arabidopsis thaliana x Arabidopsis arenosa]KAG7610566.1 Mog1/PsbP alpha/beta/alpha sandwich [Arabidopsis suecica]AED93681.1 tagatose-6-phosphate ketose/aldose isomerase, putative (Mog1/PsbP/DUF1795-like photosystem II reaction center PsbP family protein) [Arabidopsis thaliana]OAO93678.1 hypot|eukprot:NP_198091.2 tagatose-6-phosphate ketose/aldose isomerase, putative (Mog1/PsbP/DUF1795-like photosystem II reaction center PsbP family protein) [Arabidopsis thaliana]
MAILLHSLSLHPPNPKPQNPYKPKILSSSATFRRDVVLRTASLCFVSFIFQNQIPESLADPLKSTKPLRLGIANTKSWFQYFGSGFAIRVPPDFEDVNEPEDYSAGLSLYGDKAKPQTFAARFQTPDGSEVLSVVIRPSNQLKITFLEAKDISDLGSLKAAARLFVPGAATIYSARTIKVKEEEGLRNYYFYEFGRDEERIALVASVNRGKVYIAGAAAPESKWKDDELKLRSAAISFTIL